MSYDFTLFRRRPGEDPLVTVERGGEGFPTTPPDPESEAIKRKAADALLAFNPKLEMARFDYDAIARSQGISVEEARLTHRHLELTDPEEGGYGVQIMLFDNEGGVTVPYWHDGEKAAAAFGEIWAYLKVICRETDYLVYDAQIGRVLDLSADFDDVLACYAGSLRQIREVLPAFRAKGGPWWKFW
jgi:hypothetical protein